MGDHIEKSLHFYPHPEHCSLYMYKLNILQEHLNVAIEFNTFQSIFIIIMTFEPHDICFITSKI